MESLSDMVKNTLREVIAVDMLQRSNLAAMKDSRTVQGDMVFVSGIGLKLGVTNHKWRGLSEALQCKDGEQRRCVKYKNYLAT